MLLASFNSSCDGVLFSDEMCCFNTRSPEGLGNLTITGLYQTNETKKSYDLRQSQNIKSLENITTKCVKQFRFILGIF